MKVVTKRNEKEK